MPTLPAFNPHNFVAGAPINNPLFPLTPGTIQTYSGSTTDAATGEVSTSVNDFFATFSTARVDGIQVELVRDTHYEDGVLVEDTIDMFAQDKAGNVWYMGEITNNYNYAD